MFVLLCTENSSTFDDSSGRKKPKFEHKKEVRYSYDYYNGSLTHFIHYTIKVIDIIQTINTVL